MKTKTDTQDCYNIAYNYLKDKYGYVRTRYTCSFETLLKRAGTVKKRKDMVANATNRDYILVVNPATEDSDKEIEVLMSQYYYGIVVKYELKSKLLEMRIILNSKNIW